MATTKTYVGAVETVPGHYQGKVYEWNGATLHTVGVTGRTFATHQAAFDEAVLLLSAMSNPVPEVTEDEYYARNSE